MKQQIQTQTTQQQLLSSGVIYSNDREIAYAEKFDGVNLLNTDFIIKIEKFDIPRISMLNAGEINNLTEKFNNYQDNYVNSWVINYFQLNKGHIKTAEQLQAIEESQLNSNSASFVLQEQNRRTDEGIFAEYLHRIQSRTNKQIWVVFEIESKRIREKVDIALSSGIRNFIFRGGKYDKHRLWLYVINSIHERGGLVFIALPRRMHSDDKTAYIHDALRFGADGIFHEILSGWTSGDVLHLNSNFVYTPIQLRSAVSSYSQEIQERITDSLHYGFSRIRAINVANSYAGTVEVLQMT